jgi:hypothetical protein
MKSPYRTAEPRPPTPTTWIFNRAYDRRYVVVSRPDDGHWSEPPTSIVGPFRFKFVARLFAWLTRRDLLVLAWVEPIDAGRRIAQNWKQPR